MKILYVVSEIYPFVKTGGLADVAGALPAALSDLGADVRIMLPAYPQALDGLKGKRDEASLGDPLGLGEVRLIGGRMPGTDVSVWLVRCPPMYERDGGPYIAPDGSDWPDNHLRFALLSKAAAMCADNGAPGGWRPDVLHANDWQTGLAPAYLKLSGARRPAAVITVHNLHFQGMFGPEILEDISLPPESFSIEGVEFFGGVSYLKAGLFYSDRITTVSPTYAREILTKKGGCGLEGLLNHRIKDITGILNGVENHIWDPAADPLIARNYTVDRLADKKANKAPLQREMGLAEDPKAPLFGIVSRLTEHKGIDLVLAVLPRMLAEGAQLAVLGSGDPAFEDAIRAAARDRPGRVAARIGYDEPLAHLIQAGADMLLIPSRFEPCGLTQLYAMRYGTLPVVRRTGGLADTVTDVAEKGTGTGFVFEAPTADDLLETVLRGIALHQKARAWRSAQKRAMKQDFGWSLAAQKYMALYRGMV